MSSAPEVVWQLEALLGEGPVWLPEEQTLCFVDIKRGCLYRFIPASRACETIELGGNPSFVVRADDGGLLVGSRNAIHRVEQGKLGKIVATINQPAHNRTNDATVDGQGRLWFGTMDDLEEQPTGTVWCLDRGTLVHTGAEAVVTNGPALSLGDRYIYRVDSGERTIWRYPLAAEPVLADGEIFIRLGEDEGYPDGVIVDAEDCLWVALWDGWAVRRYSPDGTLLQHVAFPCAHVTKLALGGPDLRTAYVATARVGLGEAELAEQPLAGSLFAFEAPAPGRVLPRVRLG